ncbi:MAG: GNAT family N-acetyltransferase [Desertimonas sp.]
MSPIELVGLSQLTDADRQRWQTITGRERSSPFYDHGWLATIDATGLAAPVEVLIERDQAGVARTFLPFQRDGRRAVGPGRPLTDYHGAIGVVPDDLGPFVERADVDELRFDHVPLSQSGFARWAERVDVSPRIDLRDEASTRWDERRFHRGLDGQQRQLARRRGTVTFTIDDHDDEAWDALARWKSAQYRRTGKRDLFGEPWVAATFARLRAATIAAPTGPVAMARPVVSTLRAGDRPVAVHLGLITAGCWHYWLPAYDPGARFASPGMLLLREMCRSAPSLGAELIDLGRGMQPYKMQLANDRVILIDGAVPSSRAGARARRAIGLARRTARAATRRLGA